jgi:peptide/nickel transport system substrate-binding protein
VYDSSWNVFEGLTSYDPDLKPIPKLAESWDLASDWSQVKLNLRKGVQWHSGREFTSDDVKWNFQRALDPKLGVVQAAWFAVETPDKYTAILKSDQPRPLMFDFFEYFNMVDQVSLEGPDAKTTAIGTGPFSFVEWVQGDHQTYVKNPNYWQSGRPYLDGFQVFVRPETQAMTQIEAGALDITRITSVSDILRLMADSKYQVMPHPNPGADLEMGYNASAAPFDNKLMRQAFNYATNRQRLVDLYQGTTEAIALPWSKNSPAYDPLKNQTYAFDLDKGKSLIQQAGVSLPMELEVLIQAGLPVLESFMQVLQSDLSQIDVKLTITRQESGPFFANLLAKTFTMFGSGNSLFNLSPGTPMNLSNPWKGNFGFTSARWEEIKNDLATETDPSKQQSLYSTMNDFILDECWEQPVAFNPVTYLARSSVHGLVPSARSSYSYTDAWLDG